MWSFTNDVYPLKLIFFDERLRRTRVVLFLLAVFLRAVFLRVDFLLLGAARLLTLRLLVVFLFGDDFLLVVFFLRVVRRLFGAAFLLVVFFLRVVFLLFGAAFLRVVFLRAVFRRAVFLRVVFLLFGAAFLRVTFRRRVVALRFGEARRRVVVFLLVDFTLFADFLLAILFIPFLLDRTLFFRLAFFLLTALRLAAGRRGFSITTSARGIRICLSHEGTAYKERVLLYVAVIYL